MEIEEAIQVLRAAGAVITAPVNSAHLSITDAAARLDLKTGWIREHLDEFPNAWRLPAGCAGERNVGELRIPVRDVEALAARNRLRRAGA